MCGVTGLLSELRHEKCSQPNCQYSFYDVSQVCKEYSRLPYCKRILLECAVRKSITVKDTKEAVAWKATVDALLLQLCESNTDKKDVPLGAQLERTETFKVSGSCDVDKKSIMFHPGRVVLQDFTGVAALVDLAALRDAVAEKDVDLSQVDSQCPADLVVDNFVQVRFDLWQGRVNVSQFMASGF